MDGFDFDDLARSLARSRRVVLGGTMAIALGRLGAEAVDAKRKRKRKKRGRRGDCPDGAPCGNGGRCRDGSCDHNVCTLDCAGTPGGASPQPCGPAGSSCQCVNRGEGVGACVKSVQGMPCSEAVCDAGEICGIPCTTYLPSCWAPCV